MDNLLSKKYQCRYYTSNSSIIETEEESEKLYSMHFSRSNTLKTIYNLHRASSNKIIEMVLGDKELLGSAKFSGVNSNWAVRENSDGKLLIEISGETIYRDEVQLKPIAEVKPSVEGVYLSSLFYGVCVPDAVTE